MLKNFLQAEGYQSMRNMSGQKPGKVLDLKNMKVKLNVF